MLHTFSISREQVLLYIYLTMTTWCGPRSSGVSLCKRISSPKDLSLSGTQWWQAAWEEEAWLMLIRKLKKSRFLDLFISEEARLSPLTFIERSSTNLCLREVHDHYYFPYPHSIPMPTMPRKKLVVTADLPGSLGPLPLIIIAVKRWLDEYNSLSLYWYYCYEKTRVELLLRHHY